MDRVTNLKMSSKERERVAFLEREQAKIDRELAKEEERRQEITKRLEVEIKRLEALRRK